MVKAEVWLKSHRQQGDEALLGQYAVEIGQDGIDRVPGRPAVSALEDEPILIRLEQASQPGKVQLRRRPFQAQQPLQALRHLRLTGIIGQLFQRLGWNFLIIPAQKNPAVPDLAGDHASRKGQRPLFISGPLILPDSQIDVLAGVSQADSLKPAAVGEVQDGNAPLHQLHHSRSGDLHSPVEAELGDLNHPHRPDLALPGANLQTVAPLVHCGALIQNVDRNLVVPGGKKHPQLPGLPRRALLISPANAAHARLLLPEEVDLIGQAYSRQRAAIALGAIQERGRHPSIPGHGPDPGDDLLGLCYKGLVKPDRDRLFRFKEVGQAGRAEKAILPEHQALGAEPHPVGVINLSRDAGRLAFLQQYGHDIPGTFLAFPINQIDAAGEAYSWSGELSCPASAGQGPGSSRSVGAV